MSTKQFLLICVSVVLTVAQLRAGETYKFDQTHSNMGFNVHQLFGSAKGQFHRFAGTIDLDREAPEKSTVQARIEVASIDTGIQKRDDHLRSADFFNVGKFPEITFQSRSVKPTGDHEGDITGDLAMHGVKRPIVLHVQLLDNPSGEKTRWKVTT